MRDVVYGNDRLCGTWRWCDTTKTWKVNDSFPLVSCLMPTYGRCPHHQHLLEEAVQSFVLQDYPGPRELIILNDCREHQLVCDVPGVIVINDWYRAPTLGDKYNRMLELARGTFICTWEDDDISLPWRISESVKRIGNADYFNPKSYWVINGDVFQFEQNTGYAHNASMYRKDTALKVGGYPSDCKQDAGMDSRLRSSGKVVQGPLNVSDSFYIYRWGVTDHLSGASDPGASYTARMGHHKIHGTFHLRPQWKQDYTAMARLSG